ncbi:MAG: hypothetical protein CK424_02030 [Legionella sp.]|nr:MAG: hypothetical protein CK424_02030 [Legionella sp.]
MRATQAMIIELSKGLLTKTNTKPLNPCDFIRKSFSFDLNGAAAKKTMMPVFDTIDTLSIVL